MSATEHEHDWFRDYRTNDPSEDTWTCTRCLVTVARNPADGLLPGEVEYHQAFPEAAVLIARGELHPYTVVVSEAANERD